VEEKSVRLRVSHNAFLTLPGIWRPDVTFSDETDLFVFQTSRANHNEFRPVSS